MRLIDADALRKCAIPCAIHNGALTDMCVPLYQIDNAPTVDRFIVTTIPVTLSDGWGHVREAYYDASRQLVFTEAIAKELLIAKYINITEQTEQLRNMRGGEES